MAWNPDKRNICWTVLTRLCKVLIFQRLFKKPLPPSPSSIPSSLPLSFFLFMRQGLAMQQAHPLQGLDYKHMTWQLATEASIFEADATEKVYLPWQVSKPHREGAGRISELSCCSEVLLRVNGTSLRGELKTWKKILRKVKTTPIFLLSFRWSLETPIWAPRVKVFWSILTWKEKNARWFSLNFITNKIAQPSSVGVYTGPASTSGKREKTGWLKTEREAAIPVSPRVKKEFNAALLQRAQANSFHSCFN